MIKEIMETIAIKEMKGVVWMIQIIAHSVIPRIVCRAVGKVMAIGDSGQADFGM